MIEKRMQEIDSRMAELEAVVTDSQSIEEVRSANEEVKALIEERSLLAEKAQAAKDIDAGKVEVRTIQKPEEGPKMENKELEVQQKMEQRGADLKAGRAVSFGLAEMQELRAVTIASSNLVVQKKYANDLNPSTGEVSS